MAKPVSRMTISGTDGIFAFALRVVVVVAAAARAFFPPSDPSPLLVSPEFALAFVSLDTTSDNVENPPWIPPGSLTRMFPG